MTPYVVAAVLLAPVLLYAGTMLHYAGLTAADGCRTRAGKAMAYALAVAGLVAAICVSGWGLIPY